MCDGSHGLDPARPRDVNGMAIADDQVRRLGAVGCEGNGHFCHDLDRLKIQSGQPLLGCAVGHGLRVCESIVQGKQGGYQKRRRHCHFHRWLASE